MVAKDATQGWDVARLRARRTGMVNSLWPHDAYPELPTLEPGATVVVADIEGPAVITCLHLTQFRDALSYRGIVLRIFWDDEGEPAVECPLADFFADGLQGKTRLFSTPFVEKVPHAYNSYLPMPFRTRARVELTNETDHHLDGYGYVEYETLSEWDDSLAYLHASWDRRTIRIPADKLELADLRGRGHLVGINMSITTTAPEFEGATFVMEGNDEHFIDGEQRQSLDYLGTEDYFSFSWGFREPFTGLHAGISYVNNDVMPFELAMYRFRDNNVLRFEESLRVRINWDWEFTRGPSDRPHRKLRTKLDEIGGLPVDFASTVYWYAADAAPVVDSRRPMPDLADRLRHT